MKSSCISHPVNEPLILVRKWQIEATGDTCAAMLLSFFEYWHNHRIEAAAKAHQANELMRKNGEERWQQTSLLQFHTVAQLRAGLLAIWGDDKIRSSLEILTDLGFISIHKNPNPRYTFDSTKHFLFHADVIQEWITTNRGPENRVDPPENRVDPPENRGPSPESREPSPESREPSPENPLPSPESRGTSKESTLETTLESTIESTKGAPRETPPPLVVPRALDSVEFRAAWADYVRFRAENKFQRLKPQSVALQFRAMEGWGREHAIHAIRETIRQGWRGIYEPRDNPARKNNTVPLRPGDMPPIFDTKGETAKRLAMEAQAGNGAGA